MITLSKRLQAVADMVIGNTLFCDVGTDHAYLPTYLLQCGKIDKAIASDVRKGPLESARRTAEEYKVSDRMELILSDGLDSVPNTVKEVAVAGMGGPLMLDIVLRTKWLFNPDCHLVLQPQSQIDDFRRKLYENGFYIESETAVVDDKRPYTVMSVRYCGEKQEISDVFSYVGKIEPIGDGIAYLNKQIEKLDKKINGLIKSEAENTEEIEKLKSLKTEIEKVRDKNESN